MIFIIIFEKDDLEKIRNKNPEIFENIYKEYGKNIYNFLIIKANGDKMIAEEVLSDTFYSAINSSQSLKNLENLSGWLFRIASRRFIDHLRNKYKNQNYNYSLEEEPVQNDNNSEDSLLKQKVTMFNIALENLKPKYQDILKLKYEDNISRKEIAQLLNVSVSSIENLLYRARESLKNELKKISKDFS